MKFVKYVIVYFIVLVIDLNLIDLISIKGITPDLVLIYLIFISLKETQTNATVIGFGAGLFQDLFSLSILGLSSLTKSLVCFFTSFFKRSQGNYSIFSLALIFFIFTIIHERIYQFVFLLGSNQKFFKSFLFHSVPRALYTVAIALILNFIFNRAIWESHEF